MRHPLLFVTLLTFLLASCKKSGTDNTPTTNSSLPTLTTSAVTNISGTTASSGGKISSDGGASITQRGVCWSTSQNPTIANNKTSDNSGTGSFSSTINNLTVNTTYYVRAYATNSVGTAYGNQISFSTLGSFTLNDQIYSLTSDVSGNVFSAGRFQNSSGKMYVGRWSNNTWSELGTLNANSNILSLITDASNNIYAGGVFTNGSGKYYVAKWNGSNWSELGTLNANASIKALAKDASNNIYAGGLFTNSSGKRYVAKWNGSTWSELGSLNANGDINAIATDNAGNVYAAGSFTNNNGKRYVAKWSGSSWTEIGTLSSALDVDKDIQTVICDASNNVYAAGYFLNTNGRVAKWNGSSWSQMGSGIGTAILPIDGGGSVDELIFDYAGILYAGGKFKNASGKNFVAKWNGSSWEELGNGFSSLTDGTGLVITLTKDASNNIYAAGNFKNPTGYYFIAKWTNSTNTWSELGK
ncbi:MAG: hypothetical protein EO766_17575 [Hydrotalea sp. AMD]|uniref:hypothetical protein n=1 Tax=Hydrotalea sp. AMD TaxID=2501297 RepID=UPI000B02F839|nr:hypothetical protein [Hydrotalea sp. AMD]RWZ83845.1 MAG: hypothetical protein EO766_17575 [Hydrotalea sp. AMD]